MYASLVSVAALLAATAAGKECRNVTVPVSLTSRNALFDGIDTPQSALDATTFAQNQTRQGGNFTNTALTGYHDVQGQYNISAQYCWPSGGANRTLQDPTVQVLNHGIGFDKTYWDLSYNNYNYSYVNVATDRYGYHTVAIDRLGIGNSSHGEPKNEIQSFLEVQGLAAVTRMLRNGTFPATNQTFRRVVHVGHSFGSAQTYSLISMYPNISDGAVLTGFSMNASFVPLFGAGNDLQQANLNQPIRFGSRETSAGLDSFLNEYALTDLLAPVQAQTQTHLNYPRGYLVNSNVNALQYLFLLPKYFDQMIAYVGERTKQPVTIGELLTLGSVPMMNAYRGPVMVITGDGDLPYCGGDCLATGGSGPSIPAAVQKNFPNTNITTVIQPNTGHGINFHYNATGAYNAINAYFNGKNLSSR